MSERTAEGSAAAGAAPFISRLRLKNYKSIAGCDVCLGPLTILVGANGSGKSNILDAIEFLCRAIATSPGQALEERGGLDAVLRQVPVSASSFSISISARTPWWPGMTEADGRYEIEIGREPGGTDRVVVLREFCEVRGPDGISTLRAGLGQAELTSASGSSGSVSSYEPDRLFLPVAGTQDAAFAPLHSGLMLPRFYHLITDILRVPRRSLQHPALRRHGEGIADVLAALSSGNVAAKSAKDRIDAYLSAIVPGATGIEAREVGGYKTIVLNTSVDGTAYEFGSDAMSDGTVRAAAVLAALFQPDSLNGKLPLVGIEEPEIALHPAAAGALFDALTEATGHVQVIATSQSSDLLDREDLDPAVIRPVVMRDGLTIIGEVDDASREIVRQRLYTLGDLMRGNQIAPQPSPEMTPDA